MKKVPSAIVKKRSRELTSVFESFTPYSGMEGKLERIWITEIATDGFHLVGHTKGYVQVLVVGPESLLGTSAIARITSVGRWSVFGEVIETLNKINISKEMVSSKRSGSGDKCSPCSNPGETCACSIEQEPCACEQQSCRGQKTLVETTSSVSKIDSWPEDRNGQNLIGWLLRKRRNHSHKRMENGIVLESQGKQERPGRRMHEWGLVDTALLGGMLLSLLTIIVLLLYLVSRNLPQSK